MRGTTGLRAAIGVVVFGQGIAPADVVFHQGLDPSNPHFATSSTEGQGSISADNFGFVSDTTIAGLTWIGRVHGNDLLTVYDLEKVEGFTVEIHNSGIDGFGLPIPETLVYTEFFATASTNAVWTGIENPAKQFGSGRIYEHSVSLGEAFEATAGTAYFVSIRARMEDSLAGWGWSQTRAGGDLLLGQATFFGEIGWLSTLDPENRGQAFTLSTVPAPGTLAVAVLGVWGTRRRRRSGAMGRGRDVS